LHYSFEHLSFIYISVFEIIFARSMLLTITCLALVNPVIILYCLLLEL
jgi:hypothetical protein